MLHPVQTQTVSYVIQGQLEGLAGLFIMAIVLSFIFMATTNLIDNMDDAFSRRFLNKIKFDRPTAKTREHIWKSKLPELEDKIYEKLSKYDLSGGQIENVTRKYLINKIYLFVLFSFESISKSCGSPKPSRTA